MRSITPLIREEALAIARLLPLPTEAFLSLKFHTNKKVDLGLPEALAKYKVSSLHKYEILKFDEADDPVTYDDLVTIIENNPDQLLEIYIQAKTYTFNCELLSRRLSYCGPEAPRYLAEWEALGIAFDEIKFKSMYSY